MQRSRGPLLLYRKTPCCWLEAGWWCQSRCSGRTAASFRGPTEVGRLRVVPCTAAIQRMVQSGMCGCSVGNGEYQYQLMLEAEVEVEVEAESESEGEMGNRMEEVGFVGHFDNVTLILGEMGPPPRLQ